MNAIHKHTLQIMLETIKGMDEMDAKSMLAYIAGFQMQREPHQFTQDWHEAITLLNVEDK